jgi:hypothetical protein
MMKKLFSLAIAIMILAGLAQAGTLKLVKPNGGEKWAPGSNQQVLWTADGVTAKVKLILFRNGSKLGRIVGGLNAGSGSYSWATGNYEGGVAPVGDGYTIRVQTVDDAIRDESDAPFSIAEAGTSGGGVQVMTQRDLSNVHVAKPDLSQVTQQTVVAQITRIDRLEPNQIGLRMDMADPGYEIKAIGQGLGSRGAPNTWEYDHTFFVAKDIDNNAMFHLPITEWNNDQIRFRAVDEMRAGYYDVYFEKSNGFVSNKVRLKVNGNHPYIQSISPGGIPQGVTQCNINVIGLDFNLAGTPHAVVLQDQNFNLTGLVVTFWSDRAIQARISPLPAPGTYYILIEYPAATPNGKGYSNRLPIEIH